MTAAERRAAEVRATRPPREEREPSAPPAWEREQWIDDGSIRAEATRAAGRAASGTDARSRRVDERVEPGAPKRPRSTEVAPEVREALEDAVPANRLDRYQERLAAAADALDRGRFGDARRLVQPVLRELPEVAFAHELAGLALYRMGQWKLAAKELEDARRLDGSVRHHPMLADCYRALKRFTKVNELWLELREASPDHSLMAEGRIVAAGALADQGDLAGALELMKKAMELPEKNRRKVHEHHLRQWYVVGDLFDRMGDVVKARRWFRLVADHDADFADVSDRLRSLGR